MTHHIETVFFDWDHTLAYTKTPQNSLVERLTWMFQAADLPYSQEEMGAAIQQFQEDVAQGKEKAINNPQTRREIVRLYRALFNYLGQKKRSWELYMRLYGTYADLPTFLFEDSRSILQLLGERGYKLGIISNHSSTARAGMKTLVGDLVPEEHLIISEEIGVHKPAKTIFRKAAARLGTPPGSCILIGDNLQVDALGAVNNGGFAQGIWLDRHNTGTEEELPSNVSRILSLAQVPGEIDC